MSKVKPAMGLLVMLIRNKNNDENKGIEKNLPFYPSVPTLCVFYLINKLAKGKKLLAQSREFLFRHD